MGFGVLGAIVIAGPEIVEADCSAFASQRSSQSSHAPAPQQGTPLACVEILGRSALERLIEELQRAGVETIALLADSSFAPARADIDRATNSPRSVGWKTPGPPPRKF
jgi:hypothetical protein